jgi:hypothetical protein
VDYRDLDLFLREGPSGEWLADVRAADGSERTTPVQFPYDAESLRGRVTAFEERVLDSGDVDSTDGSPVASRTTPDPKVFGEEIFAALLGGGVSDLYRITLSEARKEGVGVRIRLSNEIPALASVPWEFMFDPEVGEFLALSSETPLVRYARLARPLEPLLISPPLRILGIVANPHDLGALNVDDEIGRMKKGTRAVREAGLAELGWVDTATWRELQKSLRTGPWHILHYIGHGDYDPDTGEGFVCLEDESGQSRRLYATELSGLLADHDSLRLCVLNSCSGARGDAEDRFSSTASALLRRGVPAVIAMQYEIGDGAAVGFAQVLYEALADGTSIERALAEARQAMRIDARTSLEWGTPVLHMRASSGVLFRMAGEETGNVAATGESAATATGAVPSEPAAIETRDVSPEPATPVNQSGRSVAPVTVPGITRLVIIAVVVGLGLSLWWEASYPNTPMDTSLYALFGFVGLVAASAVEALIRFRRSRT